jgi:VanZ family protein
MKALLKYHGPAILWALFIFIMCTVDLGGVSKSTLFFPGFDKLAHCGFFFVLVVFWHNGVARQHSVTVVSYKWLAIILTLSILYGGLIELLQWKVFTWRSGEWDDLFADAVGASMGVFGIIVTTKAINYREK